MHTSDPLDRQIEAIVSHLKKASRLLFITGAGLSADSNLPTYRGIGGLYNDHATQNGMAIEEALSGHTMASQPHISWRHIGRIEAACRDATHNRGHEIIAKLESHFEEVWVMTQNVDGFHHSAGSSNVIDIHGSIHHLLCTACGHQRKVENYAGLVLPPECPKCTFILRPNVVLFGEMLPTRKLQQLAFQMEAGFDMIFSIGTSSLFAYIMEPILAAKSQQIPTVEINPGRTEVSHVVDYKIKGRAAEVLDRIWKALLRSL